MEYIQPVIAYIDIEYLVIGYVVTEYILKEYIVITDACVARPRHPRHKKIPIAHPLVVHRWYVEAYFSTLWRIFVDLCRLLVNFFTDPKIVLVSIRAEIRPRSKRNRPFRAHGSIADHF